jgi:DNA-binding YbaB/EbfC family protein
MGMNQQNMMRQLQDMQRKLERAQEELGEQTVEGTAGGGAITVTMTGHHEVRAVKISRDAVDPDDVETLEDLVVSALNDASKKAQELQERVLGPLAGGVKIPGLF